MIRISPRCGKVYKMGPSPIIRSHIAPVFHKQVHHTHNCDMSNQYRSFNTRGFTPTGIDTHTGGTGATKQNLLTLLLSGVSTCTRNRV